MTIPYPERGQPLDVGYIYTIVESLNKLIAQTPISTSKYVTVDVPGIGQQSVKTSDAKIIGGYKEIVNSASKTKGDSVGFSYDFNTSFKYTPIAVATPLNIANTSAGKNVSVVLKTVTTSKVEGVVIFNETGDVTVALNIIVVGIPN